MFETLQKYMSETAREDFRKPVEKKPAARREYAAARVDRTTSDWVTSPVSTNQDLRQSLRRLRERSRDIAKNDPYAKHFLRLVRMNVVGTGINLQVKTAGKTLGPDAKLTSLIEDAWKMWSRRQYASASQKLSFTGICDLFMTQLARDGEVLVRKVYDPGNPFGFSLKFYGANWLDENYNDVRANGNRVIMSVEVDDMDRPVAYWLTTPTGDYLTYRKLIRRVRVPASEMYHRFLVDEDEDTTRGVPWLHASMIRLRHLAGYEEAELVAARGEACQMGIFIPPSDDTTPAVDEDDPENQRRITIEEAEPGMFYEAPPGYDFKQFDPKHPNANAEGFKKTTLRGVAAGAGVSYHTIAGDLESVNYSSARIGSLDDRDHWKKLQQFIIEDFCNEVYRDWHEAAYLSGALNITLKDFERTREPAFRGRGWSWVDPQKDAQARVLGLQNGFDNLTDILAERGVDIEEFFETRRKEIETAAGFGFDLTKIYEPKQSAPAPAQGDQNGDQKGDSTPPNESN